MTEDNVIFIRPGVAEIYDKLTPDFLNQAANELVRYADTVNIPLMIVGLGDNDEAVCLASQPAIGASTLMLGALEQAKERLKYPEELIFEIDLDHPDEQD